MGKTVQADADQDRKPIAAGGQDTRRQMDQAAPDPNHTREPQASRQMGGQIFTDWASI